MNCRHCGTLLQLTFVDLGSAPPSNAYLTKERLAGPETWYPLRVLVCTACWLVQTEDHTGREELFADDYAYFSSTSAGWLAHSKAYVEEMVCRFDLGADSMVVEVAANDGYLLQYVKAAGVPCYGVEPTASTAAAARKKASKLRKASSARTLPGGSQRRGVRLISLQPTMCSHMCLISMISSQALRRFSSRRAYRHSSFRI